MSGKAPADKETCKQRSELSETAAHGQPEKSIQAEGTASAKALRQGAYLAGSCSSKEADTAGMESEAPDNSLKFGSHIPFSETPSPISLGLAEVPPSVCLPVVT